MSQNMFQQSIINAKYRKTFVCFLFVSKNRWPWFCLSPKIDEDDKDISIEFLIILETYACGHDPCFP